MFYCIINPNKFNLHYEEHLLFCFLFFHLERTRRLQPCRETDLRAFIILSHKAKVYEVSDQSRMRTELSSTKPDSDSKIYDILQKTNKIQT